MPMDLLAAGGVVLFVSFYFWIVVVLHRLMSRGREYSHLRYALAFSVVALIGVGIGQNASSERYLYWPIALAIALGRSPNRLREGSTWVAGKEWRKKQLQHTSAKGSALTNHVAQASEDIR